ncbi:dihydropyrimidinase [Alicyclobacillus cycloheptanicus]|uniref:Dihydropyrimidinase n=1 Tax=Alicyclobacillus cycloheptanicus TaxID=1457 RepID=A0ABT9XEF4_9BACL|nr:dihydropyrimidinase [Alicyclobacillus cycloheptanicus]MDQ0188678.1 dihydropyrimidinase [Alicyclobacillus cycloheptanicus]WDM00650.1 dihydropyrimidinase [Alicyclobacillus cycloheptanicus]
MGTVIRGGTVVTAADIQQADVLIEGEVVTAIAETIPTDGHQVIDAGGCYVIPGGIDPHTHLDMPFGGTVTADDFRTGTIAAAHGGTTTVIDFALHKKGDTLANAIGTWHGKAEGKAAIDYAFHVMVGDMNEQVMNEIPHIVEDEGVTSFKVFMAYKNNLQVDDETLFRTLRLAAANGALVQVHAENGDVVDVLVRDALAKGHVEPKYHALTRPPEAEGEATERAIRLAEIAQAPLYVVHVTCEQAAEAIGDARKRGLPVFGETCPQYLVCDYSDYERPGFEGAKYVMSPPLRDKSHQTVLWNKLKSGELLAFGSDQCSFNFKGQKELGRNDFSKIPNGAPTIEDRMAILYHHGVNAGRISLNRFVALTSTNNAKLFGLFPRKGTVAVGSDADIVIWDPNAERVISASNHHMNVDNNIFEGMAVRGQPRTVLLRGSVIVDRGQFLGEPGRGRFQRCGKVTATAI